MRWKYTLKEFGVIAVSTMKSAQTTFGLLDIKEKEFDKDLQLWFKGMEAGKRTPGIILVAVKETHEGGGGSISVLHHVTILKEGTSIDVVGLDSLDATMVFKGVKSAELFGRLIPHKGARKAGASDYFVPSVDGLVEGVHPMTGKFVPGAKDVCATIQSLESKNNGVFVPFPLAILLLGEEVDIEESDDEEGEDSDPKRFDPRNPMDLLNRLVKVMAYKKKHQNEWYRDWKAISQEVVGLLWSVGNGFAPGVQITPVEMNRQLIEHQMKCSLELFNSDKSLYEGDTEYGEGVEEVKEGVNDFDEERSGGAGPGEAFESPSIRDELNSRISAKSSIFSKGTPSPSPSPRKERTNISLRFTGEDKDEEKETNNGAEDFERRGPRRSAGIYDTDEASPSAGIPEIPDWAENLVNKFMSGFLSTAQALSTAGVSLSEFAEVSKSSLEKKEEKKKAILKWLPSGVFLFKVLSAEDGWNTRGVPELTDFALKLVDHKIFGATQLIRAQKKALKWPGGLLKPGVGEFLKRGFISEDVQVGPSGFSVLFFHPSCYADTDSEEFSIQQLNESFGDGKLPEEMMKTFSRLQIWVPQTVQDAEEQIDTAIRFLKSICGDRTIATGGYEAGLVQLSENRRLFREKGTLFLLNYMYMLDRVFQSFCQELLKYEEEEDPIQTALLTGAKGWMEKVIEGPFQNWLVAGTIPLYSAPSSWDDRKFSEGLVDLHGAKGRGAGGAGGGGGGGAHQSPPAKKRKVEKSPDDPKEKAWHRELDTDEYIKDWFLPEGEEKNFFNYFSPSKPENFYGFPKVTHHKTGRPSYICVRHIVGNGPKCGKGIHCPRSHIRMNDLSADEKGAITKTFKRVYGTGGKAE